jgi:hypothetical protein
MLLIGPRVFFACVHWPQISRPRFLKGITVRERGRQRLSRDDLILMPALSFFSQCTTRGWFAALLCQVFLLEKPSGQLGDSALTFQAYFRSCLSCN